jgi:polysaccharide export outer membrane protein
MQPACGGRLILPCSVVTAVFSLSFFAPQLAIGQSVEQKPAAVSDESSSRSTEQSSAIASKASLDQNTSMSQVRLGPGDLVEVSVYNIPELTTKARISSNGDLYLPLIDYVHVGDLTQEEAQKILEKRYADGGFVNNPHVTVFISEYSSGAVTLLGEVARPGPYPIIGERRLYDVFSAAGGLTEKAGKTVVITHRNDLEHPVTVRLGENMAQTPETNLPIRQGDTIVVRRAGIVYVVGDVGRPSGFLMDNDNLTVLRAIALAGGTTRTAKLSGAKLLRKTPAGVQETTIALNKILQAKAPDIPMKADDVLFVPSSAGKVAAYRGTEAIMQTATALSIIAVPRP